MRGGAPLLLPPPRFLRANGARVSVLGLLLGHRVLDPRRGNQEQRREQDAEEDVDPGEADVVGAHPETGDEGSKGPAK
jgi:hypothetical protein